MKTPEAIDLSLEGDRPQQFLMIFRQRSDDRRSTWCCRLWLPVERRDNPANPYKLRSLNTGDANLARQRALKWRRDLEANHGPAPLAPSFATVAEAWIKHVEVQRAAAAEYGDKVLGIDQYRRWKSVTRRYLVPYFGSFPVNAIPQTACAGYGGWRKAYYVSGPGRADNKITYERNGALITSKARATANPGRSTVAKDVEAFNKIISFAQSTLNALDWSVEPRLKKATSGTKPPARRLRFSRSQVQLIFKKSSAWIQHRSNDEVTRWDRAVLSGLVNFLWLTGARTSEALVLNVGDIRTILAESEYALSPASILRGHDGEDDDDTDDAAPTLCAMDFEVVFPAIKWVSHARVAVPRTNFEEFYCSHGAVLKHRFCPDDSDASLDGLPPNLPLFPSWEGGRTEDVGARHSAMLDFATSKKFPNGLRTVSGRTMSLSCWRHTYASEMIEAFAKDRQPNMVYWLARNMGTSEKMIEEYYGQLLPAFAREELRR